MGTHHDAARLCLTEDAGQTDDGNFPAFNNVAQHVARSHTGQLVDVEPTNTIRIVASMAFSKLFIRMMSIIEQSSTINASASKGFSSFRL